MPHEPHTETSQSREQRANATVHRQAPHRHRSEACHPCLVRSELLRLLSARLEHAARNLEQLVELLRLDDEQLIEALGGHRRQELRSLRRKLGGEAVEGDASDGGASEDDESNGSANENAVIEGSPIAGAREAEALCVHSNRWQEIFGSLEAPRRGEAPTMLWLAGGSERLRKMLGEPVVAIVGSRRSSEYAGNAASQLGHRLALAKITVASPLAEGISAAALSGALQAGGTPLAAAIGGIDLCQPAHLRSLREGLLRQGCLVAELPPRFRGRRWSARASARTILSLSQLVIFVEAEPQSQELELAALALSQGKAIAATPGQLGCPRAEGPHRLIREGATLIRCAEDVLELVCGLKDPPVERPLAEESLVDEDPLADLDPRLRDVLGRIGNGEDTLGKLGAGNLSGKPRAADTLLAVSELEALGLLRRGRSGHYLPQLVSRRSSPGR